MDEEFIFQVTEEELAQFPEEGNQTEEEQNHRKINKDQKQGRNYPKNPQKNRIRKIAR